MTTDKAPKMISDADDMADDLAATQPAALLGHDGQPLTQLARDLLAAGRKRLAEMPKK